MEQKIFKEKYHIFEIKYKKDEISFNSVDEIIENLKGKMINHPVIAYISTFDQYAHTKSLEGSVINSEILDGKNIVFCFGKELPTPEILAVRPRSIGVCELEDHYVVNFLEAPNETANESMEALVKSLKN